MLVHKHALIILGCNAYLIIFPFYINDKYFNEYTQTISYVTLF